jgi:predicted ATPase
LSEQIPPARRILLRRDIGERKAVAYGVRSREIAAELAYHCEESCDAAQAVQYYQLASQAALQRSAYLEALDYCTRGLELLPSVSDTPQKARDELLLQSGLGVALFAVKGFEIPDLSRAKAVLDALAD